MSLTETLTDTITEVTLAENAGVLKIEKIFRYLPNKRLTVKATWQDKKVVAKIFFANKKNEKYAKHDSLGMQALNKAGVPTAKLLFHGRLLNKKHWIVIYEYLPKTRSFAVVWEEAQEDPVRKIKLLETLMATMARLHQAGLWQRDCHLDNFLLANMRCYVIDGDAIIAGKKHICSAKHAIHNLALCFAQFAPSEDKLLEQAWATYCSHRQWDSLMSHKIWRETMAWRRYRIRKYLKKIFRNCTDFRAKKTWRRFWVCDRSRLTDNFIECLNQTCKVIKSQQNIRWLKKGRSVSISGFYLDSQHLIIKKYHIKNFWHRLKRACWRSRAAKSWRNAHLLKSLNIATPSPIALVESRFGPFRKEAYFISEPCPGQRLYEFFQDNNNKDQWPNMLAAVRQLFDILWQFQISHGDMKSMNFFYDGNKLYVIDLDGMRHIKCPWRFKSAFSKDIKRFCKNWHGQDDILALFAELKTLYQ